MKKLLNLLRKNPGMVVINGNTGELALPEKPETEEDSVHAVDVLVSPIIKYDKEGPYSDTVKVFSPFCVLSEAANFEVPDFELTELYIRRNMIMSTFERRVESMFLTIGLRFEDHANSLINEFMESVGDEEITGSIWDKNFVAYNFVRRAKYNFLCNVIAFNKLMTDTSVKDIAISMSVDAYTDLGNKMNSIISKLSVNSDLKITQQSYEDLLNKVSLISAYVYDDVLDTLRTLLREVKEIYMTLACKNVEPKLCTGITIDMSIPLKSQCIQRNGYTQDEF